MMHGNTESADHRTSALESSSGCVWTRARAVALRLALPVVMLGGALAGGCSAADCKPPVAEGTRYKATLLAEATDSDACHIIDGFRMSPFEITAGKVSGVGTQQDCSTSPASGPPKQTDIKILSCLPAEKDMLGVYCEMQYPAMCEGAVNFHFDVANHKPVDSVNWSAPVVEGIEFIIQDSVMNCFPDQSGCRDVYTARLERLN
jgi:hypothetical protein